MNNSNPNKVKDMTKEELVASIDRDIAAFMGDAASVFEDGYPMTELEKARKHIEQGEYARAMSYIRDTIETSNALDREEFDRAERALAAYKAQIMSKAELIAEAIAQVRMAKEREVFQWTGG